MGRAIPEGVGELTHDPPGAIDCEALELVALNRRAWLFQHHCVALEPLSVRERKTRVLQCVTSAERTYVTFVSLFGESEGRRGVVVTFLAIMELARERLIEIFQNGAFTPIHVRFTTPTAGRCCVAQRPQSRRANSSSVTCARLQT